MDFRYDFSDGRADMIYDSEEGESLDVLTWRMMVQIPESSCLLKTKMEEREWGYSFRYDISGVTNMMAWQEMAAQEEKEDMLKKIQRAVSELKQWYIPKEELVLEQQYLYVDDRTEEVRFICIPLVKIKPSRELPPKPLVEIPEEEIPSMKIGIPEITPSEIPPVKAVTEYRESLPVIPPVPESAELFEEAGESYKKKKGFWERNKKRKSEKSQTSAFIGSVSPVKPSIPDSVIPEVSLNSEKISSVPSFTPEEQEERTMLLNQEGEEGTVLLNTQPVLGAVLVRVRSQEHFMINKNPCRIGKKASEVDVCIQNNPALSRVHCVIRYLAGFYYLEDCHSSNFTFVDGKRALPGESVKLTDSCRIQMADEEFVFKEN